MDFTLNSTTDDRARKEHEWYKRLDRIDRYLSKKFVLQYFRILSIPDYDVPKDKGIISYMVIDNGYEHRTTVCYNHRDTFKHVAKQVAWMVIPANELTNFLINKKLI